MRGAEISSAYGLVLDSSLVLAYSRESLLRAMLLITREGSSESVESPLIVDFCAVNGLSEAQLQLLEPSSWTDAVDETA